MESTGKREKRLKTNTDLVPIPSDESDVNDEVMIPFNFHTPKAEIVKDPIAIEMETDCDSSCELNELIAAQINKLNNVDQDEYLYRKNANKSFNIFVFQKKLHCTICQIHIGYHYGQKLDHLQHPLLKVLACSECINNYNKVDFKLSPDGQDQFCRWCGNTPMEKVPLRHCRVCPFAFCETCIYYNLSITEHKVTNNWLCAVCNMKEIWTLRNIFSSLVAFSRTDDKQGKRTDLAQCCANTTAAEVTSDNHSDMKIETKVEQRAFNNSSKDINNEEKTSGNPQSGLTESQTEVFYRLKYRIKPCSVRLIRVMFPK